MNKQKGLPAVKKGKSSWKPASAIEVVNKDPNYRYRWSAKTPDNLAKKDLEGWETVSDLQGDSVEHIDADRIEDGKKITSVYEKHDCILQRIPEEIAQERDAYINSETARRTKGLTAHLKKEIGKEGGVTHGDITISSRRGTEIID